MPAKDAPKEVRRHDCLASVWQRWRAGFKFSFKQQGLGVACDSTSPRGRSGLLSLSLSPVVQVRILYYAAC